VSVVGHWFSWHGATFIDHSEFQPIHQTRSKSMFFLHFVE